MDINEENMRINKFIVNGNNLLSLRVVEGLGPRQMLVLGLVAEEAVCVEPVLVGQDHFVGVDIEGGLVEEALQVVLEAELGGDVVLPAVELLEILGLDDGPDGFLGVGFAGVGRLEEDLEVLVHEGHVLVRLVGPVVVQDEDGLGEQGRLADEDVEEAAELGGVGGVRGEEDGPGQGLGDGAIDGDVLEDLQIAPDGEPVAAHPCLAWLGRGLEGGLVAVDDLVAGIFEDL